MSSARRSMPRRRRRTGRSWSASPRSPARARRSPGAGRPGLALHKPAVTSPIVGASKPQHLEDAVAALSLKLTPEEIAVWKAYVPHAVAGFD